MWTKRVFLYPGGMLFFNSQSSPTYHRVIFCYWTNHNHEAYFSSHYKCENPILNMKTNFTQAENCHILLICSTRSGSPWLVDKESPVYSYHVVSCHRLCSVFLNINRYMSRARESFSWTYPQLLKYRGHPHFHALYCTKFTYVCFPNPAHNWSHLSTAISSHYNICPSF